MHFYFLSPLVIFPLLFQAQSSKVLTFFFIRKTPLYWFWKCPYYMPLLFIIRDADMLAELLDITQILHRKISNRTFFFSTDKMQYILLLWWLLLRVGQLIIKSKLCYWLWKCRQSRLTCSMYVLGVRWGFKWKASKLTLYFEKPFLVICIRGNKNISYGLITVSEGRQISWLMPVFLQRKSLIDGHYGSLLI